MPTSLTRRSFTVGSLATVLGGTLASSSSIQVVSAQGTTDLASLGLPTLDITVMASTFEGVPEEVAAGRYLLNVTTPEDLEFGSVGLMSPPPGLSAQEFLDSVGIGGPPPDASPDAEGPSSEMSEATPADEGGEEDLQLLPLFVYQATFAGGTAGPGGTAMQVIIDLPPGEWIVWGDDPTAPQRPVIFMVTGDMPADLVEPESDITTTYIDFAIDVQGSLTAGDHLMLVQNHGAQPHFLVLFKGPDSLTREHIAMLFELEMSGEMATPESLPFDPETDLVDAGYTGIQSIGTMQWAPISLEAGNYAALCFFPTAGEGLPHANHGMYTVFTVE